MLLMVYSRPTSMQEESLLAGKSLGAIGTSDLSVDREAIVRDGAGGLAI
jgi:hypothetical protein